MWTDRYTVYYSTEIHYAVRRLEMGQSEDEAEYQKFDDKAEAEHRYNTLVAEHPDDRIEIFFSQAKWVRYSSNHDEFGRPLTHAIGQTDPCLAGAHDRCNGGACTCLCHGNIPVVDHAAIHPNGKA